LGSAVNVAQHYVKEHERGIIGDAYEIANNIQHDPTLFDEDKHVRPAAFFSKLNSLTKDRGLQASYIVDGHGNFLAQT
jgi:nitrogen fixation/metabolism regulation signal transduction histidine kinase